MAAHWTYEDSDEGSDLEQGDILEPTEALRQVLDDVHPHFCADKYVGFCVATQSCDLVRRGGRSPKASYVTIASVRPLRSVLPRLISTVAREVAPNVFRKSGRSTANDLLERIFGQNEQALGLFYLHPDLDAGITEPSVAFLRVTVALRALHYDALLDARRGRLKPEFRAKFGWLIGNLYSRAATRDWHDDPNGKAEIQSLKKQLLPANGSGLLWIEDELVDAARGKIVFEGRDHNALQAEFENYRPKPRIDQAADAAAVEFLKLRTQEMKVIGAQAPRVKMASALDDLESAIRRLDSDQESALAALNEVRGLLLASERLALAATPEHSEAEAQKLRGRLISNGMMRKLLK